MNRALILGATIAMTQIATAAPYAAKDPRIDPQVRSFLSEVNKDSTPFWTLPGPQVRAVLTGLQSKTPVDLSGVIISEKTISENGQSVKLYIMKPENAAGRPPVLLFIHGGVWIAGDFENHGRLVRDLVVRLGAPAVVVEFPPIPDANFPNQVEHTSSLVTGPAGPKRTSEPPRYSIGRPITAVSSRTSRSDICPVTGSLRSRSNF